MKNLLIHQILYVKDGAYQFNLLSDAVFIQNDFLTMLMVIEDLTLPVKTSEYSFFYL